MKFGARTTRQHVFFAAFLFSVLSAPALSEGGGADVLFGLAAITSAASPAVVAGIQASADKTIAQTNANASIQLSQIAADVSKYQTDTTEKISAAQNITAMQVNGQNQKAQTDRLSLMLMETAAARNQAYALKQDDLKYQYALKRQELQMAEIQREENYKLAVWQMQAEKVKAGLSNGLTSVASSLTTSSPLKKVASTTSSVGTQVYRAVTSSQRLLGGIAQRGARNSDRITSYGFLAQGSTRALRQRGVSDLSAFQSSLVPARALASDEGLHRHRMVDDYDRSSDKPSHTH